MMRFYVIYLVTITYVVAIGARRILQNEIQAKARIMNISYNKCSDGKTCVHGVCNENSGTCACYYGWRGVLCDRLARSNNLFRPQKSSSPRFEAYTSRQNVVTPVRRKPVTPDNYVINLLMTFFPNLKGYFKRFLELGNANKETTNIFNISPVAKSRFALKAKKQKLEKRHQTTTEKPESIARDTLSEVKQTIEITQASEELVEETDNNDNDVCSDNYKMRPLSERMCTPGLVCKYGSCSSDHKGSYIAFDCSCDDGAKGLLCDQKCCLDCGGNGRCAIFADGSEYCACRKGYFGESCEHSKSDIQLANRHFDPSNKPYDVTYTIVS